MLERFSFFFSQFFFLAISYAMAATAIDKTHIRALRSRRKVVQGTLTQECDSTEMKIVKEIPICRRMWKSHCI